jgi:hypothetical protein
LTDRYTAPVLLSTREISGFLIGSAVVVLLMFGAFAVVDFSSNVYVGIISSVVGLVVFLAVLAFAVITIQVCPTRVIAKSTILRFKLANVSLDDVSTVTLEPFSKAYWGGWGLRLRGRDKAVVLNGTEAVAIEKRNGRKLYLATQEAPRVAAALKSYDGSHNT